ncbi:hypothetical protein OPFAMLBM_00338 [Aeromonas phage avDM12-TAAL]|nr:hypothetical protein OPFAMLBM_00338 [Aeromonas phage avDM12-TAAL]
MKVVIRLLIAFIAAYGVFFASPEQMRALFALIICVNAVNCWMN